MVKTSSIFGEIWWNKLESTSMSQLFWEESQCFASLANYGNMMELMAYVEIDLEIYGKYIP